MMISKYLGATAIMAALAMPAYAQTVIIQDNPASTQFSGNGLVIFSPGTIVNAIGGQEAVNITTGVGTMGAFGVAPSYTIQQTTGAQSTSALFNPLVEMSAINVIEAVGTGPALSNVVAGGNQLASNSVNVANIAPLPAGTLDVGVIGQSVANAGLLAINTMAATVQNGNASVIGSDGLGGAGFQDAYGSLNTAGVLVSRVTNLKLEQVLGDANTVVATNSAIANSIASGMTMIDPSVSSLNQSSVVGINQLALASAGYTPTSPTSATVNLSGAQNGTTPQDGFFPDRLQVTIGNSAAAYTGPFSPDYNIGSNAPGNGIASVTGVTQNAGFGLNNVSGGAGVSLVLSAGAMPVVDPGMPTYGFAFTPADGFTQSIDGTYIGHSPINGPTQLVYTPDANVLPGVVNGIAARTDVGTASVTGSATALTQGFGLQLNSLSTGGSLSGVATQAAANINEGTVYSGGNGVQPVLGMANVTVANANTGTATITNVSQRMDQSVNTAGAGTGAPSLTLTQLGGNIQLGSNNVQVAAASTSATITGAQQVANTGLNVASLGAASGMITQATTGPVNLGSTNQLVSLSGFNASTSGFQSSSTSINVIK